MSFSRRLTAAAGAAVLTLAAAPGPASADVGPPADPVPLTSDDRAVLVEFFHENDVDPVIADRLISQYESGTAVWDSLDPAATPVSIREARSSGYVHRIATYQDGSIHVSTVPELAVGGDVTPFAVRACTYSGSNYAAYWRNCIADENWGVYRMQFTFDYENVREQGARITSPRNPSGHAVGFSLGGWRFETRSATAVRLHAVASFAGVPASARWIQANVSGSTAWTTFQ